jgi:integrase
MGKPDKSAKNKPEKPPKPYEGFELFPHNNGSWAKKINGKIVYFGPWADWRAALKKYHALLAYPTKNLKGCIERYNESRKLLQQSGEITLRHRMDIERTLAGLLDHLGSRTISSIKSEDFGGWRAKLTKTNGVVSLTNHIMRVRAFLNWCIREHIITAMPACDALRKPSRAQQRHARNARGSKMFEAEELRRLMFYSSPQMRAMLLLALNAALANNDIAQLTKQHLQSGWLVYPRPKTGIQRRVPLWPETRVALKAVIREDDDVIFRTKQGNKWDAKGKNGNDSPISLAFRKLSDDLGLHKPGRGFASIRHVAQTVGENVRDIPAIQAILGHAADGSDMDSVYREEMTDERLMRVVKHIRKWLGLPTYKIKMPD